MLMQKAMTTVLFPHALNNKFTYSIVQTFTNSPSQQLVTLSLSLSLSLSLCVCVCVDSVSLAHYPTAGLCSDPKQLALRDEEIRRVVEINKCPAIELHHWCVCVCTNL